MGTPDIRADVARALADQKAKQPNRPAMDNMKGRASAPALGPRTFMHEGKQITLNPAKSEDDPNGYWDAKAMGNGKGRSFYTVNDKTYYLD